LPEYINPNGHTVYLTGADGKTIKIGSGQRRMLPEFFERYVTKGYLKRVGGDSGDQVPHKKIATGQPQPTTRAAPPAPSSAAPPRMPRRALGVQRERQETPQRVQKAQKRIARSQPPPKKPLDKIVGRRLNEDATQLLRSNLKITQYPISNGIGIGVLSYNRQDSLRRLVESIRKFTDLRRTTVFISDDASTDAATKVYLDELAQAGDLVVLRNQIRLGVAGNTNRLMRCLARFQSCLLLNDDVEILKSGWDHVYARAMAACGIKHFCMRQPGVYGAKAGEQLTFNGISVTRVLDKPHGAIMSYTNEVFDKVGFFDERFGIYGMEHVDWSNRVHFNGIQPAGYYDLATSGEFFRIHSERSAVENRERHLSDARRIIEEVDPMRGYVEASPRSSVPIMTCVIPCRDTERHGAIATVIAGIKAQRFPALEVIVAEHDTRRRVPLDVGPIKHLLVPSNDRPFNKAKAFNSGVTMATTPYLMLHDADLILPASYTQAAYDLLQAHDAGHFGKTVVYLTPDCSTTVNASGLVESESNCERVVGYFEGGSLVCRRRTYWLVGGFHEDFWGYGVEDCEFYDRLSHNSNWREDRRWDFVHLWHGRSPGWDNEHKHNKVLGAQISNAPMEQRIQDRYAALRDGGYGDHLEAAIKGMI